MKNRNVSYGFLFIYILTSTISEEGLTSPQHYWRDYVGHIPKDAISSEGIYIAQIPYNGLLPASLYPNKGEAVSECNGKRLTMSSGIKVLCDENSDNFYWEYVNVKNLIGDALKDLVVGGTEGGSVLYIGKVFHEGVWKIGKVFPPESKWKGFRGWFNNDSQLYPADDFQIMKYRTSQLDSNELVH